MFVLTTPKDHTANDLTSTSLVNLWRQIRTDIVTYEFDASQDIAHISKDPVADEAKKQLVCDRILELLGEPKLR